MDINNISAFTLVLMRMFGFILFNPILGRKNVPDMARVGMALLLAIIVYNVSLPEFVATTSVIEYGLLFLKEFFFGYILSFILMMFTSIVVFGGEIIDMQIGISMAKIYDPQSNISMAISSSFYNVLFMLMFFVTDAHLNLINILLISGNVIEYGKIAFSQDLYIALLDIFSQTMILSIKLALPIIVIELLLEMGVGILMKAIPQINIFSLNIQLKLFLGIVSLFALFGPTANFIERLITILFETIESALSYMIT